MQLGQPPGIGAREAAQRLVIYLAPGDAADAILDNQPARQVVRLYQRAMGGGLLDDGYPGPATRRRIEALLGSKQAWTQDVLNAWPDPPPVSLPAPTTARVPLAPMTLQQKFVAFGKFDFSYDPQPLNIEHISIGSPWPEQNIGKIEVPQLARLGGRGHLVMLNQRCASQFLQFFEALEQRGLISLVRSFDGGWAPRFVRQNGSADLREATCRAFGTGELAWPHVSNHAWGNACDLNAQQYPLGTVLAADDPWWQVIAVANEFGLASGADYVHRKDPQHFEIAQLLP